MNDGFTPHTSSAAKAPSPYRGALGGQPPPFMNSVRARGAQLGQQELQVLRQHISDAGFYSLRESGVNPEDLLWYVQATGASLRSSVNLNGGFLAETSDLGCIYFRYTPTEGFQVAKAQMLSCKAGIVMSPQSADLTLDFPSGSELSCVRIQLTEEGVGASGGWWFDHWREVCAQKLGAVTDSICLSDVCTMAPKQDDFGVRIVMRHKATILAVRDSGMIALPSLCADVSTPAEWRQVDNRLEILTDRESYTVIEFSDVPGTRYMPALAKIVSLLPESSMSQNPLSCTLDGMGFILSRLHNETSFTRRMIQQSDPGLLLHAVPLRRLTHGCILGESLILVSDAGECMTLDIKAALRKSLLNMVQNIKAPMPSEQTGVSWTVALVDDKVLTPTRVILMPDRFCVNDVHMEFKEAGDASVKKTEAASDLYAFSFSYSDADDTRSQRILTSQQDAYYLWEEWEVGRTRQCTSTLGFPDLYRRINADRRHEFLLALYGDILFLNRALQDGVPMEELIRSLEGPDVTKLVENKALRDETVAKMILLLESINRMRQSGEVFASLYPYFWIQQESEWLKSVFGSGLASSQIAQERKLVPALRRQIRGVQSELFRSLLQIEAASRSIDALLGKDEIRKHWSSKAIKFGPGLVQAGIGTVLACTGNAQGLVMLASAVGIQGLGSVLGHFQQDREGSAQIMKAASVVFPWWDILMTTLPVSLYESAQFLDEENMRAMKRDRAITDSLKPDQHPLMLKRLRQQLVAKIINNRRKAFREVIQGSGLRVIDLFDDIKQATTVSLKGSLDAFVAGMTLTPDKAEQRQGGTND
jgi:hypothetical protein